MRLTTINDVGCDQAFTLQRFAGGSRQLATDGRKATLPPGGCQMSTDYSRYEKIKVELDDSILRVTLCNPEKRNIVDGETNKELGGTFQDATFDPRDKEMGLAAAGKVFSAGGDLVKMHTKLDDPARC